MASNTCAYCAPPFFRFANRRSPIVFITRTYLPPLRLRPPPPLIFSHCATVSRPQKGRVGSSWIEGPESIADHMYRMALMALIAGDLPGVNRERCIKIAIVHDIAEAIVGDITPSCGVPKEEKRRREQAALTEMCKILGGGMRGDPTTVGRI
ncbi:HD domain-containing protein 2 [Hibiscus syriacus]|uniref:HD domain-containing protein 2 n=1 Tax=Hibiscus syriacus TaxID=106335 RepID=A0A6A2W9N3_HIBSY|nr:HD domain-containing protein 2 [Hibiscus syriacus]